jgi:hypothetical protein
MLDSLQKLYQLGGTCATIAPTHGLPTGYHMRRGNHPTLRWQSGHHCQLPSSISGETRTSMPCLSPTALCSTTPPPNSRRRPSGGLDKPQHEGCPRTNTPLFKMKRGRGPHFCAPAPARRSYMHRSPHHVGSTAALHTDRRHHHPFHLLFGSQGSSRDDTYPGPYRGGHCSYTPKDTTYPHTHVPSSRT